MDVTVSTVLLNVPWPWWQAWKPVFGIPASAERQISGDGTAAECTSRRHLAGTIPTIRRRLKGFGASYATEIEVGAGKPSSTRPPLLYRFRESSTIFPGSAGEQDTDLVSP
jgi:hypothetical protein